MTRAAAVVVAGSLWCVIAQQSGLLEGLREKYTQDEAGGKTTDQRVLYWEQKHKAAPQNVDALLNLTRAFLQKNRETTDFSYIDRASGLIDRVLTSQPDHYNALRLRLEIAMNYHRFPRAVQYADQLLDRNPSDSGVAGLKGDALMEMGHYDEARASYERMMDLGGNLFSYNRYAYYRFVTGKTDEAVAWMTQAVQSGSSQAEHVAWCQVELGDLLFKTGKVKEAESAYRGALQSAPGYHRANAALGRLTAARGDTKPAIEFYKAAQASVPFPEYAAALDTLFRRSGNVQEANRQRNMVDAIDQLAKASGEKGNRTLALIFANEGRKLDHALELARGELEVRGDLYTYDALAWSLYKAGKLPEAVKASEEALKFETAEPIFYFHSGVIAAASGNTDWARTLLGRALNLNPQFDFEQAGVARDLLRKLNP